MSNLTITEALAEIKTIDARISKKREFVIQNLVRQEMLKDPLEKEGGTRPALQRERQSINDLMERKLALRRSIQQANETNTITMFGTERTISDWLVWRREVAPLQREILSTFWTQIQGARGEATRKGYATLQNAEAATKPTDVIVNIDEAALAAEREALEELYGALDGQLSLRNATVMVEI